jgi:ABC-type iron transport system FetAB ATPase subunit
VGDLSARIVLLSQVEELLRALMDALVLKQVRAIESMVTEGLQSIFHDQDLHFEAEVSPKYNKISIDFFIRRGAKDSPLAIRGKPLDSFGGGPTSVSSLLLRVLALMSLKRFPLLLLDETLAAVSEEYTDKTGQFLRTLATKLDVPLLMITHKPAYLDHATQAYRCAEVTNDDGTSYLQLKKAS